MKKVALLLLTLVVMACSANSEKGILKSIDDTENELRDLSKSQNMNVEEYKKTEESYIQKLISFYRTYPESEKAPECLDKVHMVYSGTGNFELASKWADTLLNKYPNYANRAIVLESQASTYDAMITPRDSVKVRKYYTMLLKEFPNLDKDKRDGIVKRLEYNKLTFDEYIIVQMRDESTAK